MSDLVVNVRQVGSYPQVDGAGANDLVLLQQGGLGGPYYTTTPLGILAPLGTASLNVGVAMPEGAGRGNVLAQSFVMPVTGEMLWNAYRGTDTSYLNTFPGALSARLAFQPTLGGLTFGVAPAQPANNRIAAFINYMELDVGSGGMRLPLGTLTVARDPVAAMEVTTRGWIGANTVTSFDGRTGVVRLQPEDIYCALNVRSVASEEFVCEAINHSILGRSLVFTFNGRDGKVELNADDITIACMAPVATPQTNTPAPLDRSFRITNTAWVSDLLYGTYWQQIQTAINDAVSGNPPPGGYAPLNSPNFTGIPTAPNPTIGNSTQQLATTWFVGQSISVSLATYAPLTNPNFAGIPTAPTANPGNSTGQIATTSFVMTAITSATAGVASFNTRTGAVTLELADITDADGAPIENPAFEGIPTVPMPNAGDNSAQIASTAWVMAEISAISAGVTSFNGRSGIVLLQLSDVTSVGGAPIVSPAFSGVPSAPTASPGTNTVQLATTAFVTAAIAVVTANNVSSFNGRTGAVTLTANDISGAGGLANPSPALTGTPTTPTPITTANNGEIVNAAWVNTRLTAVTNGYLSLAGGTMTGAIVLSGNATANLNPVTLQQMNAATAGLLPLAGGVNMTGQFNLSGNATGLLQPVTLQQLNAAIANFPTTPVTVPNGGTGATSFPVISSFPAANTYSSTQRLIALTNGTSPFTTPATGTGTVQGWLAVEPPGGALNIGAIGTSSPYLILVSAGGTMASPSVLPQWSAIGNVFFNGYAPGTWGTSQASIISYAAAVFTATNQATNITLNVVPAGSTTITQVFAQDGTNLTITTNAIKPGGGSWSAPSDGRLKANVRAYGRGLAEILQLNPIAFTYRQSGRGRAAWGGGDHIYAGLAAEDVQKIIPEIVGHVELPVNSDHPDTDVLTVDPSDLVYMLINAVQELKTEIDQLKGTTA